MLPSPLRPLGLLFVLMTGCSTGANASGTQAGTGGGGGTDGGGVDAAPQGGQGGTGGTFLGIDAAPESGTGGTSEIAEVWGHSGNALFRLDPETKQVTQVGLFQGCSGVIDIALDRDSNMLGTTTHGLHRIDKDTAECTLVAMGSFPNSLSFVPKGTVDPDAEALVGYLGSDYVRINPTNGQVTIIGRLSGYTSSGDIVSVIDGGTYLTVKGTECDDCLLEVNPTTGDMIENLGPVGYADVFGLAFWAGTVYGFTAGGVLFQVDLFEDPPTYTQIPIPDAPSDLSFWGAGSKTSAPPVPIPK